MVRLLAAMTSRQQWFAQFDTFMELDHPSFHSSSLRSVPFVPLATGCFWFSCFGILQK